MADAINNARNFISYHNGYKIFDWLLITLSRLKEHVCEISKSVTHNYETKGRIEKWS